jgi:hypothetical protein
MILRRRGSPETSGIADQFAIEQDCGDPQPSFADGLNDDDRAVVASPQRHFSGCWQPAGSLFPQHAERPGSTKWQRFRW